MIRVRRCNEPWMQNPTITYSMESYGLFSRNHLQYTLGKEPFFFINKTCCAHYRLAHVASVRTCIQGIPLMRDLSSFLGLIEASNWPSLDSKLLQLKSLSVFNFLYKSVHTEIVPNKSVHFNQCTCSGFNLNSATTTQKHQIIELWIFFHVAVHYFYAF